MPRRWRASTAASRVAPGDRRAARQQGARLLHARPGRASALATVERAPAALRATPDFAALEGNLLYELQRYEDAVAAYERGLAADGRRASLWTDRGNALREFGRFDAALESYDRALALEPEQGGAVYGRATLLPPPPFPRPLRRGLAGLRAAADHADLAAARARRWHAGMDGSPLAGRGLLLHGEQGLGDTDPVFARCRYRRARRRVCIVEVQPSLAARRLACKASISRPWRSAAAA